jgi:hypothetical protein
MVKRFEGTPDRGVKEQVPFDGGGSGGSGDASAANQQIEIARLEEILLLDFATETTLDSGLGIYSRIEPGYVDVVGPTVIDTPANNNQFFVRRIWMKAAYDLPDDLGVQFIVRLGSTIVAYDDLIKSQPYVDSIAKLGPTELGSGEGALSIELDVNTRRIYYNVAVREIA